MRYSSQIDHRFNVRDMIERTAAGKGAQVLIEGLSDLDAVRRLQELEGYTPCFGREVALRPASDGRCLVTDCCWKNFCAPYRQTAVPLDNVLTSVSKAEIDGYVDFLLSRRNEFSVSTGLNVTIGGGVSVEALSRKLLIGSPRSVFSESIRSSELRPIQLTFHAQEVSASKGRQSPNSRFFDLSRNILWTADPSRMFRWFKASRSFIDKAVLDFEPHITAQSDHISVWKTEQPEFATLTQPEFQLLSTPHVASLDQDVLVSDPNFVPLLNLDIPFIESASLEHIQRLMDDYPDELTSFRNYLFSNIDTIRDRRIESGFFIDDVKKVERSIKESLKKLNSDIKRHRLKHFIELGGGAFAGFTLSLYCFLYHESSPLSVVGPGGFAFILAGRVSDYFSSRINLRDNSVQFLWLIGQSHQL